MAKSMLIGFQVVILLMAPSYLAAQVTTREGPIVYGHHHLNATSVAEHKKFWIDTLGGGLVTIGSQEFVRFPHVLIVLTAKAPTGPTEGSSMNHVGFEVSDLRATVDRLKAAGYAAVTRPESPTARERGEGENTLVADISGPDNIKVELREKKGATGAIALDHVHFQTSDVDAMRDWYVKVFGAKAGRRGNMTTAELPGVSLTFSKSDTPVAGTRGRALDHIGFEIKNLEAFTKRLETMGIKLDRPYARVPQLNNLGFAFITDPWGTYIELNEGLEQVK
jgi:catechol 2,3-dioxygenase-like lactoylglutathione lyase family enzyme